MASKERVGLYVDGDNFYHTQTKHLFFDIDVARFMQYCEQYGELTEVHYYLSLYNDEDEDRKRFSRALMNMHYGVSRIPIKRINTVNGVKEKSRLDTFLLLDIPEQKNLWDICIVCSGDSDLEELVKRLRNWGKRVIVISTASAVSEEMRMLVGTNYVDLLDIRDQIERKYNDECVRSNTEG